MSGRNLKRTASGFVMRLRDRVRGSSSLSTSKVSEEKVLEEVQLYKPCISENNEQLRFAGRRVQADAPDCEVIVIMSIDGIRVVDRQTGELIGHYPFQLIPDFHVGAQRETFQFAFHGPEDNIVTQTFESAEAMNMLGTATAFVDRIVAERKRQITQQEEQDPDKQHDPSTLHPPSSSSKRAIKRGASQSKLTTTNGRRSALMTVEETHLGEMKRMKQVNEWNVEDVINWVKSKGMTFVDRLRLEKVDGKVLIGLEEDDWKRLGVDSVEMRLRLLRSCKRLQQRRGRARTMDVVRLEE